MVSKKLRKYDLLKNKFKGKESLCSHYLFTDLFFFHRQAAHRLLSVLCLMSFCPVHSEVRKVRWTRSPTWASMSVYNLDYRLKGRVAFGVHVWKY